MPKFTWLFAFLLIHSLPAAARCEYHSRVDDEVFHGLPAEIKGWVQCPPPAPSTTMFTIAFVARFAGPMDHVRLVAWLKNYAQMAIPAGLTSDVIAQSGKALRNKWLELETRREFDSIETFLFTAADTQGELLAFIYTDNDERAKHYHDQILSLRQILTSPEFIRGIPRAKQGP